MSMFVKGVCLGTQVNPKTVNTQKGPQQITEYYIGVQVTVDGGFPGQTETLRIKASNNQFTGGIFNLYAGLQGKAVIVPVWVKPWVSGKGTAGYELHLSGEGKPVVAVDTREPKAAASAPA